MHVCGCHGNGSHGNLVKSTIVYLLFLSELCFCLKSEGESGCILSRTTTFQAPWSRQHWFNVGQKKKKKEKHKRWLLALCRANRRVDVKTNAMQTSHIAGLVQERRNSSVLAMELRLTHRHIIFGHGYVIKSTDSRGIKLHIHAPTWMAEDRAWMSDCIPLFYVDVITYPLKEVPGEQDACNVV